MPDPSTRLSRARELVWRLVVTAFGSCMRHRVTGLAAEAALPASAVTGGLGLWAVE